MDLYISSLLLGVVGLAAMALSGLGSHGHSGHGPAASGGHAGHSGHGGHGGPTHINFGHLHGGAKSLGAKPAARATSQSVFWSVMSPRFLFSFALGFGAAGELVRDFLGGPFQLGVAVVGGIALERFLVTPLWNFSMRFASTPALTLESAVSDEATAVTAFDADGHGIVSVELDGQIVQILATLQTADRSLGVRVRAGQRVRIEDVQPQSNRCTVSLL